MDRMESFNAVMMKGGMETPDGKTRGKGGRLEDSPNGAEWFLAPRKGGIGKA
jgi:hypothetical protein